MLMVVLPISVKNSMFGCSLLPFFVCYDGTVCTYMVTLCLLYGDNVHTYVVTLCHPCGDTVSSMW